MKQIFKKKDSTKGCIIITSQNIFLNNKYKNFYKWNQNDTKEAKTKIVKCKKNVLCSIGTAIFLFACHINFTLFSLVLHFLTYSGMVYICNIDRMSLDGYAVIS